MDSSHEEDPSLENTSPLVSLSGLATGTNPKSIREYDAVVGELKRENFDLKLRIFFLEQQNPSDSRSTSSSLIQPNYRQASHYEHIDQAATSHNERSTNTANQIHLRLSAGSHQSLTHATNNQGNDETDELHALRAELGRFRQENEQLRQKFLQFSNESIGNFTSEKNIQTATGTITQSTVDNKMPVSAYTLQFSDRERKLQEQTISLEKQIKSLQSELFQSSDDLKVLRQKYEAEIRINQEHKTKAERVLKRVQHDYDKQIAHLQADHKQKPTAYESYRHEPLLARIRLSYPLQDQASSNVNVEEYHREIEHLRRTIKQLENQILLMASKQPTPIIQHLPALDTNLTAENFQRLNEQIKSYATLHESLRNECEELRRNEQQLRQKINDLLSLLNVRQDKSDTPTSIARQTSQTVTNVSNVENPHTAIAQVTTQIRSSAESVSTLTNSITKLKRDYENSQGIIHEKDTLIQEYRIRESEIERRIQGKYDIEIETLEQDKNNLRIQIQELDYRLKDFENLHDRSRIDFQNAYRDMEIKSTEEKQILQEQNQTLNDGIHSLQIEITEEQQKYNNLQTNYQKLQYAFEAINVEELQRTVQQQKSQIENFHLEHQTMEVNFQKQQLRLEEEYNFVKVRVTQMQSELDTSNRLYNDARTERDEAQLIIAEQQNKFETLHQSTQNQITQYIKERDNLTNQLEVLRLQRQTVEHQLEENEDKYIRIAKINEELTSKVSVYENHFHDFEDERKKYQSELIILQREAQNSKTQHGDILLQIDEWRRKYETEVHACRGLDHEKRNLLADLQLLTEENATLKHELDNIAIRIRVELRQEYESDYVDRYSKLSEATQNEIDNIMIEKQAVETDIVTKSLTITNLESQLQNVQHDLHKAHAVIQNYEIDIGHFREDLNRAEEANRAIKHDISKQYASQLNTQNDRIKKFESQNKIYETQINQYKHELEAYSDNIYQLEQELAQKNILIQKLQADPSTVDNSRTDFQIKLNIRYQQLEEEIQTYRDSLQEKDQQIEQLRREIKPVDNSHSGTIEALQQDISYRQRLLDEKTSIINEHQHHIGELKIKIQDYERRVSRVQEQLQHAEQTNYTQQLEIDELIQKYNSLNINFQSTLQDNEIYLNQIKDLEMERKNGGGSSFEQREHYQSIIDALKEKFEKEKEKPIQIMDGKLKSDLEKRDQFIATLQQTILDKDQEINKLCEINDYNQKKLEGFDIRFIAEPTSDTVYSSRPAPTNVSLQVDMQKKEREIEDLRNQLKDLQRGNQTSSTTTVIHRSKARVSSDIDQLNREELLYELDVALQHIETLNQQLKNKNPSLTELHKQLVEVRDELTRQKYVSQVLWRKLDALIDIHGSNTRAELAIELADYKDELGKLKNQQSRPNDSRPAKFNNNSRSSSEQNLSALHNGLSSIGMEYPTKNIKSTIALLERSNIEWQTKLARLTEQLGRSEHQSRNYHRELNKYQKMLYEAGLIESSVRQRRRSADDSIIIGHMDLNKRSEDLTEIRNIDELKEMIHNQRKFIQQLQMRVRINTSDIIQSPIIGKLKQQIQNLNLVIDTYKSESNLLKNELKKLYKTIEHNRKMQQNYEKVLQEQQLSVEQAKKQLKRYEQMFKKYDTHLPIFDERKQHLIDPIDDYVIDLDIDVLQESEAKKKHR
ncbi:unnamed protein product [Rotaria magnacalcarata]|uniref:Centrosomin N-terminal motif 1 domain-containing protein n=1 Tax=Rotaria magnacalcarata TaxID=392030 RepID=A0A816MQ98_9BILA|nr:unnamed protein product [Rotaria magnacalcarata]